MTTASPPLSKGQIDLFAPILDAYATAQGPVSNDAIYERVATAQGKSRCQWDRFAPVGKSGELYSIERRKVRWFQQTLKEVGLIERVEGPRGYWRATDKLRTSAGKDKDELTPAPQSMVMLGFSTKLGVSLWASAGDVFSKLNEPIHLCLTSPPYPLAQARAYGNPKQEEYVDWVCRLLEPIIKNLVPGGSIALNVSNDIFVPGMPARSLYREELLLALCKRFGLYKMDEIIWHNPTKAPGPIAWASKQRYQLNVAWEPVYWLTNDPMRVLADNRRVLVPHKEQHLKLMATGGEKAARRSGDGANRIRKGAFSNVTAGAIPRNLLPVPHRCPSQIALRKQLAARGLPMHGATFPLELASFFVKYLTEEDHLVVDPCDGWGTTSVAAEINGRRWVATERMLEYVRGKQLRFQDAEGFETSLAL